jgi:hypothetical protein
LISQSRGLGDVYKRQVIVPSGALTRWLKSSSTWQYRWCSSQYSIQYNEESTLTLFMLVFDGMVSRTLKLEKRPD